MRLDGIMALLAPLPLKAVGGIEELAKIGERPNIALPAAYVLADNETGGQATEGSAVTHQTVISTVAVVIVARPDGARQGASADLLHDLGEQVLAALFGRQPAGWDSVLTLHEARTIEVSPTLMTRVVRLRGRTHRRRTLDLP